MKLPKSTLWLPVLWTALIAFGVAALFFGGYEAGQGNPTVRVVHAAGRPPISPSASLAQVRANIAGKSYVHGVLSELPGFVCDGWTNGKAGHGWIVLVCSK